MNYLNYLKKGFNRMVTLTQSIQGYNLAAQARRLSPHTLSDYANTFKKLLKFTSDLPLDQYTPSLLRQFLNSQTVSSKTLLNYHVGLSALFNWLQSEELITTNPMRQVARPKPEKRLISPFTESDLRALFSIANKTHDPDRTRALLFTLLDTGLRASELCAARILDLDLKNRRLKVMGKGSKERSLPLSPKTAQSLWKILIPRPDDPIDRPLFLTQQQQPLTRDRLLKFLNSLGTRASVPDCHPHRFRHTFAVLYLRNGGDPFTLQLLLGHSDMDTVRLYLTLAQSDLDARHRLASPVDRLNL